MHLKFGGLLLPLLLAVSTHAQETKTAPGEAPLWELGIGAGGIAAPDYPGSDHNNLWLLPFPWGVYRGEILHSDRRGGTRARIFRLASYEFNVSAGGGLPSSSNRNGARQGMPDLEWLGEAGPRLMIDLWTQESSGRYLRLGVPFRAALSTNGRHLVDRGFILAPELLYDHPGIGGTRLDVFMSLNAKFADTRFANYFYGVTPDYARPDRPAFRARLGYIETEFSAGVMVPLAGGVKVFTFGSVQSLDGSANEKSPLFKTKMNSSLSLVLLWVFAESKANVQTSD